MTVGRVSQEEFLSITSSGDLGQAASRVDGDAGYARPQQRMDHQGNSYTVYYIPLSYDLTLISFFGCILYFTRNAGTLAMSRIPNNVL